MNVVIIGGKNREKLSQALLNAFDSFNVLTYADTNEFIQAISTRAIDVHRVLLMESGIMDLPNEDDGYDFVNRLQTYYPAAKLISICQNRSSAAYLSNIIVGTNYAHFVPTSTKVKMMTDFASMDIPALKKRYKDILYVAETKSIEEEVVIQEETHENIDPSTIPGLVQKEETNKPEKRSFVDRLFGRSPKKPNSAPLLKDELKAIGQGQGVEEFSQPEDNMFGDEPNDDSDDIEYTIFTGSGGGNEVDEYPEVQVDEFNESDEIHRILEGYNQYGEEEANFEQEASFNNDENENIDYNDDYTDYNDTDEEVEPVVLTVGLDKKDEVSEVEEEIPIITDIEETQIEPMIDKSKYTEQISNLHNIIDNVEVETNNVDIPTPIKDVEIDTVEDVSVSDIIGDTDLDSLVSEYNEQKKEVVEKIVEVPVEVEKVVEKVVEVPVEVEKVVEKIVEVPVEVEKIREVIKVKEVLINVGSNSFRNTNGVRILIVTGDRRSGVTKLALNLSAAYAQSEKVLYVDFDINRKGSLGYLGLSEIINEPEHIQNGLTHFKSLNMLSNLTYLYSKGGFYNLISMYGEEVTDEQVQNVQRLLCSQNQFSTVIIDCPMDKLWLLEDIVEVGNVLICMEDDKVGYHNSLIMLDAFTMDEKVMRSVCNRGHIVVTRKGDIDKFSRCRQEFLRWFDYSENLCNWTALPILGSCKNIAGLLQEMEV